MHQQQTTMLRLPAVKERVGLSNSQIWKMVKDKTFPQPVKLSANISAWIDKEVENWIQERIAASRNSAQQSNNLGTSSARPIWSVRGECGC